jgi:type I restriction enzyme S subunit
VKNTNNVPRLRFPKFTDDWERRKLDTMCEIITKQTGFDYSVTIKPSLLTESSNETYSFIQNKDFSGNEINLDTDFYIPIEVAERFPKILLDKPSLLISISGRIGNVGFYNLPQKSFIGGAVGICKLRNSQYGEFLVQELGSDYGQNYFRSLIKASSHANITVEDIRNINIIMPKDDCEQEKIASYFNNLDNLITLHQRKCDKLEEYKKAMLQKIFSQELRFKREDGTDYSEWSNKRFANAFTPLNNNTFSRDMLSENGTVLNIHYGDILVRFGEVCDIQTMDIPKVNTDIDTSRFDELQNGDIVLADTAEDETVGKAIEIYHIGTSKVVSGLHTMACRPTDKYAPKYMGYYINSPTYHNQLLPFMQGIKVTSIGRRNIADTVVYYPYDIEEQQKIADFLSALDEAINYAKQELDKWKELKKGLLQQMFV